MVLPNASFLLLVIVVGAVSVLPLLGIFDVWSKHRFTTAQARVLWTVVLVIAGLPALVCYAILVKTKRRVSIAAP